MKADKSWGCEEGLLGAQRDRKASWLNGGLVGVYGVITVWIGRGSSICSLVFQYDRSEPNTGSRQKPVKGVQNWCL